MPTYDFRCRTCGALREVRAGHEVASALELVCTGCGGSMVKAFTAAVRLLTPSGAGDPPSSSSPRGARRPRGGDSCDAAIHLTRPNPFADGLPARAPADDAGGA
jgi:putative FmdB family regulatory protein